MQTKTQPRQPSHPIYANEGLSPKKTALIIVTVIGCIAILWPKVFHPMMFGSSPPKPNMIKEPQRGPAGLRQERPAHLHPESIYQAMRERGRAIPATTTIPILERKGSPSNPPPRYVEGRPGPIPGMRPPMGAGALHQPQAKGNSMGFIMPIYTIGIIVFFGYTIMKIVFKKPIPNAPYGPAPTDPNFRKDVFGLESRHVEDLNGPTLGSASLATSKVVNTSTASATLATTNILSAVNNHHNHHNNHGPYPYDARKIELYNASLSAANAASNLSTSLKQHQQKYQQQQQLMQQQQRQQEQRKDDNEELKMSHETDLKSLSKSTVEEPVPQKISRVFNKETDQLMEIETLRKKLEDTERAMAKLIAKMNEDNFEVKKSNEHTTLNPAENISNGHKTKDHKTDEDLNASEKTADEHHRRKFDQTIDALSRKRRDGSADRSVAVLGMEVTASCEGGQKWSGRPSTPDFFFHNEHSKNYAEDMPKPQSIYLEGALAHETNILISDAQTKREEVYDDDLNGSLDEPAVVLSSKMTLSLINLDRSLDKSNGDDEFNRDLPKRKEVESPLADDIEIIGHVNEKNDE